MPTIRITALPELAEQPADDDVLALEDISAGTTKKVTSAHVRAGLASNAGLSAEVSAREAHEAAANPHSGSASTTALGLVDTAVSTHVARTDNPHSVTAAQAGAIPATSGAATPYVTAASETAAGISALATLTEVVTGTDTARVVTVAAARQAQISLIRDSLGKFPGITPPSLNLFCGDATDDTAPAGTFTRSTTSTRLGQTGLIETVGAGSLRREWDDAGNLNGWKIEENRTNMLMYSEQINTSTWAKSNCSITADSTVAPDGTTTADKVVENSAASVLHYVDTDKSFTVSAGSITFSIFAKAGERSVLYIYLVDRTGILSNSITVIDLSTGTITSGSKAKIISVGNGWYRISITITAAAGVFYGRCFLSNGSTTTYTGDGSSGLYLWGAQVETGLFATSYIQTTTTSVARSSDVWTYAVSTSWFKSAAGTLFVAGKTAPGVPIGSNLQYLYQTDDGPDLNRFISMRDAGKNLYCAALVGGAETMRFTFPNIESDTKLKIAFSWSASGFSASINGGACVTTTPATLPSGLTTHRIGSGSAGGSQWGGHIRHIAYFPVALSDTQLQAITL